jgi:hypothetical protein
MAARISAECPECHVRKVGEDAVDAEVSVLRELGREVAVIGR